MSAGRNFIRSQGLPPARAAQIEQMEKFRAQLVGDIVCILCARLLQQWHCDHVIKFMKCIQLKSGCAFAHSNITAGLTLFASASRPRCGRRVL